jgi:hypothetical protein
MIIMRVKPLTSGNLITNSLDQISCILCVIEFIVLHSRDHFVTTKFCFKWMSILFHVRHMHYQILPDTRRMYN